MTAQDYMAPESVGRLQQRALIVGIVGVVACIIGYREVAERFFHSYLMAFMFVLGLSLGSLGLADAAASDRRPLGHHDSPAAGIRHARASAGLHLVRSACFFGITHLYGAWLNAPPPGPKVRFRISNSTT